MTEYRIPRRDRRARLLGWEPSPGVLVWILTRTDPALHGIPGIVEAIFPDPRPDCIETRWTAHTATGPKRFYQKWLIPRREGHKSDPQILSSLRGALTGQPQRRG